MRGTNDANLEMVSLVARHLGPLRERVVFLGGAVVDLLITDPSVPPARPTRDVDLIVDIVTRKAYYKLREELLGLGFKESLQEDAPLCRWTVGEVRVDIMPIEESVLGFTNSWHKTAMEEFNEIDPGGDLTIRVISAPCFLAVKLEAFARRGRGDFLANTDMEDIIAVLGGRKEITEEAECAPEKLKRFVGTACRLLLDENAFHQALPGHFAFEGGGCNREQACLSRMQRLARLADLKRR